MHIYRFVIAATAVAACSGAAMGRGTITMTDPNGGGNTWRAGSGWNGGAFMATSVSGFNGMGGGPGGSSTTFLTFCLEISEHISLGGTYNTIISDRANGGGNNNHNDGPGDPISAVTAAIYKEFRSNGAHTFGSANIDLTFVGDHSAVTQAIQQAIWFEEDEISSLPVGLASTIHAWGVAYAAAHPAEGIGNVRVMQLYNSDGSPGQDQLTLVPLPSAAFTGLASMAGIIGFGRRRRGM